MSLNTVPTFETTHGELSGYLLDALCEAVVAPADPAARAAAICALVQEMCASLEWRHAGSEDPNGAAHEELMSISQLAAVAQDHRLRMEWLSSAMTGSDES